MLPYSKERVSNVTQKDGRGSRLAFIPMTFGLIVTHVALKALVGDWGVAAGIVAMGGVIVAACRKLRFMGPKDVEAPDHHVGWHRSQN